MRLFPPHQQHREVGTTKPLFNSMHEETEAQRATVRAQGYTAGKWQGITQQWNIQDMRAKCPTCWKEGLWDALARKQGSLQLACFFKISRGHEDGKIKNTNKKKEPLQNLFIWPIS